MRNAPRSWVYGVLTPLSTILQLLCTLYIVASVFFLVEKTGIPGENHQPAASC